MKRTVSLLLILVLVSGSFSVASAADYRLIYDENDPHCVIGYAGRLPSELTLPEGITSITKNAFRKNGEIEKLILPESLKSIGSSQDSALNGAFKECPALREVRTGNGLQYIGPGTFSDCPRLEKVILGNSVGTLGERCFWSDPQLKEIDIPDSVTWIGYQAFCASGLQKVRMGSGLTATGSYAFYHCGGLTEVELGENLQTISESSFADSGLRSLTIPAGVEGIAKFAFSDCLKLESVRFADDSSLTDLSYGAFAGTSLTRVVLPVGLQSIGGCAFNASSIKDKLLYIYIPATVTSIGGSCFSGELETVDFGGSAAEWDVMTWNKNTGVDESHMTVNFNVPYPGQPSAPSVPSVDPSTPLAPSDPARGMSIADALAYLEMARAEVLKDGQPQPADAVIATGMVLRAENGEETDIVVRGDVLGTGKITISQLVRLAQGLTGTSPLAGPYLIAGDLNESGKLEISDLVMEASLVRS